MTCEAWPVEWPCDTTGKTPEQLAAAVDWATTVLWGLGGRHLGVCEWVERYWPPCTSACGAPYKGIDGEWRNRVSAAADCCRILLRHTPVVDVSAVTVWGEAMDPGAYDVVARRYLRRRGACWPCEDLCDDPPIEVVYRAGVALPPGTAAAVGEVACEVLAGLSGGPCRLPSRAVNVTRQGVTVQLADPAEFVDAGLLGLPLADAWIRAVNPAKLVNRSRVYSPDLARSG